MFGYETALAFVLRIALFFMLFASYPLFNLFLRTHILNIFWQGKEITSGQLVILNIIITAIPLTLALVYQEIGTILAFTGSIGGLIIIYTLPVMVHLKRRYTQITNPLLAEAITLSEFKIVGTGRESNNSSGLRGRFDYDNSPQIAVSDRLIGKPARN